MLQHIHVQRRVAMERYLNDIRFPYDNLDNDGQRVAFICSVHGMCDNIRPDGFVRILHAHDKLMPCNVFSALFWMMLC